MDRLRRKDREEVLDFDALERDPMSKFFDGGEHYTRETGPMAWTCPPDAALSQKEFFIVLESCLGKLPEKFRQIFLMREMEGLDRDEVGEKFSLTGNNVGVILHRVRVSLQHCLQKNWFGEMKPRGGLS
jgi:RNA polymerase sigma-70 factor (ECF subfamily)